MTALRDFSLGMVRPLAQTVRERVAEQLAGWAQRAHPSSGAEWMVRWLGGDPSAAGVTVSHESVLKLSAAFACARILAGTMASLPVGIYRRLENGGRERATDHDLWNVIRTSPNPLQTSYEFREQLQFHVLWYGRATAHIEIPRMEPVQLWPLLPHLVRVAGGPRRRVFMYRESEGGREESLLDSEVLHIPWISYTGKTGMDPMVLGKETFGSALATQQFAAEFYKNEGRPSGYLKYPGSFRTNEARKRFRESWNESQSDWGQKHETAVLEGGVEYVAVAVNPQLAQMIESREFSVGDVARFFGVQAHLVGDLRRATFSNIEEQQIEFVQYTMLSWARRWEQAMSTRLLSPEEQEKYFIEFDLKGLMRGNVQARGEFYRIMREVGGLNANEIRALENLNPREDEDGEAYWRPLNMLTSDDDMDSTDDGEDLGDDDDDGGDDPSDDDQDGRTVGPAELRSARAKQRISHAFRTVLADLIRRALRREEQDILPQAERKLDKLGEFREWLLDYYVKRHAEALRDLTLPAYQSIDQAVRAEIAEETRQPWIADSVDPELLNRYMDRFSTQYTRSAYGQLNALLQEPDPLESLRERFDQWGKNRPEKVSLRETVSSVGAFTVAAYGRVGVRRLRWVAIGESCPYCHRMHGRIVETGRAFVQKGDSLPGGGDRKPLYSRRRVTHPPIHSGCDCTLVPG